MWRRTRRACHALLTWCGNTGAFGSFLRFKERCTWNTSLGVPGELLLELHETIMWECIDLQSWPLVTLIMIIKSMFALAVLLRTHPP